MMEIVVSFSGTIPGPVEVMEQSFARAAKKNEARHDRIEMRVKCLLIIIVSVVMFLINASI